MFLATMIVGLSLSLARAESGIASHYSTREGSGSRTACGPRLRDSGLTVAHKHLRCGTRVRITNRRNGHSVIATVIDRGPFIRGRIVDLSLAAARAIGMGGLAPVTLEVVK